MNIFDEGFRTICTRRITFSRDQMINNRIKAIFNSIGNPDYLNAAAAEETLANFNRRGEFCLLEASNEGNVYIISNITFEDIWSRNFFAIKNKEYYERFPDLITIYN